jgi:hypothetical protein
MKLNRTYIFILLIFPFEFVCTIITYGQDFQFHGQASTWETGTKLNNEWNNNFGVRYFPQVNYSYSFDENNLLNGEVLLNTYYTTDFHSDDYNLKLYRAIVRYTTTQSETQLGLQKINFGPAQLLRTLMWFDSVDPRDPLKLTDGVYGLRYKYSFLNNSIFWVWGLYGNSKPKGYEINATAKDKPEFGGRYQFQVPLGEAGATLHTREVNLGRFNYRENRYALDGRWDIGIGAWFEAAVQQSQTTLLPYQWNKMVTVGGDYTFGTGNGIYVLAENMTSIASVNLSGNNVSRNVSAMMATYPVSVLDNIAVQEYYDWQGKNIYQYYQWQRTYDNVILNLGLFHYPANGSGILPRNSSIPVAGYGFQLTVIYNY